MPYYRGDYYRGDYYRGDPGLLGGIGKFLGGAVKTVGGFLPGPIGTAAKAVGTGIQRLSGGGTTSGANLPMIAPPSSLGLLSGPPVFQDVPKGFPGGVPQGGTRGGIERFLPFGQSGYNAPPAGYHVNKAYMRHLRAQAQGRQSQDPFKEPRAKNTIVKNRRMNPLNPRALRASVRRQRGAVSLMRRAMVGTGYTISRKGMGGKRRKR